MNHMNTGPDHSHTGALTFSIPSSLISQAQLSVIIPVGTHKALQHGTADNPFASSLEALRSFLVLEPPLAYVISKWLSETLSHLPFISLCQVWDVIKPFKPVAWFLKWNNSKCLVTERSEWVWCLVDSKGSIKVLAAISSIYFQIVYHCP